MASVEEFAQQYAPVAARVAQTLKVDPSILLGQWGLETGWGKSVIPGTNNLGNIKDLSGGGTAATDNMTGSQDRYRIYASPDAFADDYASLIQRKYPQAVGLGTDAVKFGRALKFGGYAEDPDYVRKVSDASNMVRGLGEKLVNFLIPAASAETLLGQRGAAGGEDDPQGRMQALERALVKADTAGNADDAKALADEIRRMRGVGQPGAPAGSSSGEWLPDGGYRVDIHPGAAVQPTAQPQQDDQGFGGELLRQVGLTARAGLTGLGQAAGIATDPLRQLVVNPAARAAGLPEAGKY